LYGSNPIVYAQIIEDLQTTHIVEAHVDSKNISGEKLLILAMNFLKCYQSEEVRSGQFTSSFLIA
jgi:ribosomal protein L18